MPDKIKQHFLEAKAKLEEFISDDQNVKNIALAGDLLIEAFKNKGKVISCGNGGSMSDAMHFAEELSARFRDHRKALPAISISDPSHITCAGNDYGFEKIFSRFVEGLGNEGDVLLAISTSGDSENVLNAIEVAQQKGMKVIGLTGRSGGKISGLADVEIRAPHSDFADRAQEIHIKVIHSLIDYVERHIDQASK
ncbi:MAG: D-sedoheptulose 7-phosphate isomerase [Flavobacteriales bacterium]|nr:D-sedoheptulose 7-phosphate isomerase [Flavobacteriales bacterium]